MFAERARVSTNSYSEAGENDSNPHKSPRFCYSNTVLLLCCTDGSRLVFYFLFFPVSGNFENARYIFSGSFPDETYKTLCVKGYYYVPAVFSTRRIAKTKKRDGWLLLSINRSAIRNIGNFKNGVTVFRKNTQRVSRTSLYPTAESAFLRKSIGTKNSFSERSFDDVTEYLSHRTARINRDGWYIISLYIIYIILMIYRCYYVYNNSYVYKVWVLFYNTDHTNIDTEWCQPQKKSHFFNCFTR